MKIAGVDPGYDRLGLAIFDGQKLLYSTCFTSHKSDNFVTRLTNIAEQFEKAVTFYKVEEIAVEELYFSKNQTTALKVAEARGVINYLAGKNGMRVYHYSPQAIKMTVTGYGNANKDQVMTMIKRLLPLEKLPQYDDEYDAIAVGLTHLSHPKT